MSKHVGFGALLEVEMVNRCTMLWREAHLEVNMYRAHHVRTTFGSCDVEKVHAVVARSTFRSIKCQNTSGSGHLWTSRCRPGVEKPQAVVARSTVGSQKCQKLFFLAYFDVLSCYFS